MFQGTEGPVGGRGLRGLQVSNILILDDLIIPLALPKTDGVRIVMTLVFHHTFIKNMV